jgi:exodeoxyribonuclease III
MAITLATWNINSVRLRIGLVRRFLRKHSPDVLCLQETKSPDEHFPREAFERLGYSHMHIHGMKGYNGVATLSRLPLTGPRTRSWCAREDCRHVVTELPGGIELHNSIFPPAATSPIPTSIRNSPTSFSSWTR